VVSHDRYFLDRVVDTIFAFEPGGTLRQYPGNYSTYLDFKKSEEKSSTSTDNSSKAKPSEAQALPSTQKVRKLSNKEKREFDALEGKIAEIEVQKAEIEKVLALPPSDFVEVQELYEKLESLNQAIETATERWLELAEIES
jgi:ATP-binding cassette subfamily F protein uup